MAKCLPYSTQALRAEHPHYDTTAVPRSGLRRGGASVHTKRPPLRKLCGASVRESPFNCPLGQLVCRHVVLPLDVVRQNFARCSSECGADGPTRVLSSGLGLNFVKGLPTSCLDSVLTWRYVWETVRYIVPPLLLVTPIL